jgi:hypothetical protein
LFSSTDESTKNINKHNDNFIKFKGSKSFLFATTTGLYARLENSEKLYCIT